MDTVSTSLSDQTGSITHALQDLRPRMRAFTVIDLPDGDTSWTLADLGETHAAGDLYVGANCSTFTTGDRSSLRARSS